jgi:DNA sulfur modification protein DndE
MKLNRIHLSEDSRHKLSILKGRTGLLPNVLCRLGFSLSLLESSIPNPENYPTDGSEFNRYTLMGEWDPLIVALLKERCAADGLPLDDKSLGEQFRAHMNRGVELLYARVKGLSDLAGLLPTETQPYSV